MNRIAPLRSLGGPFIRLSDRWARVRRHRRLNLAVLGCLFVMFGLVVALVLAVRSIDAEARREILSRRRLCTRRDDLGCDGEFGRDL